MKTIEVRISKRKLTHLEHSVHIGNHTMRELRAPRACRWRARCRSRGWPMVC